MRLTRLLIALVAFCDRRARTVLLVAIALSAMAVGAAWLRLGVSTDTDALFADSLPWRQRTLAFNRDFPQFQDLIVAVIDADSPEAADLTADQLETALRRDPAQFETVRRPDSSPYFDRVGLMFLDAGPLQALLDRTIDAQPFLGQLAQDPSARGLFSALSLLGIGVESGQADLTPYLPALRAFHGALASAMAGRPQPLSWASLLGGDVASLGGKYRFVLVQPRLDYAALQPGGAATESIRTTASKLEFVASGQARVRLTGSVPLADEEFTTVAEGAVTGLAGSFVLIALWLTWALRSWRLIVPALTTLVFGLLMTVLFAALAVGTLNLVSVGFGILFVGIAVDFAIQFCVRYREAVHLLGPGPPAMRATAGAAGPQVLIAAAATAAGFLAFVPTDFSGVAELGLIAGVGMLVAFVATMTVLPAMIGVCGARGEAGEVGFAAGRLADRAVARARWPVLFVFAVSAVVAGVIGPRIGFDADPLHTKKTTTEAVRTLYDLMDSPITNPFTIDVLTPDIATAVAMAARLRAVPEVGEVVTLDGLVPADQARKLAAIADARSILGPTLAVREPAAPVTGAQIRMAANAARGTIARALTRLPADHPLRAIEGDLQALAKANDTMALEADRALTRFLPEEITSLRTALAANPVTRADVPAEIARDWVLPDGRARVQVVPTVAETKARDGLSHFVAAVRAVAPDAGGSAVTIVATSDTIIGAFRGAALGALGAITLILAAALRRDAVLVLLPLLLSAALTVLAVVATGLLLNYANIIALPLLLGVGVSFNIYFVMNWRSGQSVLDGHGPLGSATARAVLFSALTTGSAFGALALSGHPGTASMGVLLLISLGATLVASFVFVPAMLAALGRVDGSRRS